MKLLFIISGFLFFSVSLNAQTVREKIDQQAKDPKAKENAAKADVYIAKQKEIADSSKMKSDRYNSCKARKERKAESRRARKSVNK
ncbi:hypothetical protein OCK74_07300 [Chitinophagaceae bacterium LB-8]|uniref:Uncharacterized protein n=1 Tax=Paraflavisolibacter caeni TaxID=2982496 RepID=A0A9X3B7V6_9BACT|nr:hypothetical protein [Paraflavisolibacter caeni]MCU7548916.1 hypothetical protein [Paraflavisolibacter caeni]